MTRALIIKLLAAEEEMKAKADIQLRAEAECRVAAANVRKLIDEVWSLLPAADGFERRLLLDGKLLTIDKRGYVRVDEIVSV